MKTVCVYKIELCGYKMDIADIDYEEPIISNHTGNELEKISFQLSIKGKDRQELFQDGLSKANDGGIYRLDNNDTILKEYKLTNHSYSYNGIDADENTIYTYNLTLEEVEKLTIESLVIAGIEIIPYQYEEKFEDGIVIYAKIKLSKEEAEKLRLVTKDTLYFDVTRKGIDNNIKKMRFGKVIWSENDSIIKKSITLVEEVYDKCKPQMKFGFYNPELSNIMEMLVLHSESFIPFSYCCRTLPA